MTPLTATQRRVLQFMSDFHGRTGYMPTRAEIAGGMGWKSANAADVHVQALRKRGCVTTQPGTARSLQITEQGAALLGVASPLPGQRTPQLIALPVIDMARMNRGGAA